MSAKIWLRSALRLGLTTLLSLGGLAATSACSTLFPAPQPQQIADSGGPQDDGGDLGDAATADSAAADSATADSATADSTAPDASCSCPESQVMRDGACVPNPLIGCTLPCLGKAPSACPSQSVCDEAAAHQPCAPELVAPACVPQQAMGFAAGDLRISPATAQVGETVVLHARGGDFYIGALMWWMRVGDEVIQGNEYEAKCDLTGTFSASVAGVYPVEVGYGGGSDQGMNQGWTLAGFLAVGDVSLGIQPGFACATGDTCASGGAWGCGCQNGRCACNKAP